MKEKKITTRLRFKDDDGNDFPEWEEKKIGQLVKISYGKDQKQIIAEDGEFPILGTGGIIGRTNQFLYDKPSVLIGRKGTIDKPVYMDSPFWTVDTLFYTQVFENTIPKWLYYKFQTINWYLYNEASGVPSLSASTINQIEISLPSIEEQTKIANFLSAIDEKIENFEKELDELKAYKKGVMQAIFNEDDQTQMGGGKSLVFNYLKNIRFKDDSGNDFPDWETTKFGLLYTFKSTNSFSRDNLNYESGVVKNLHYGDIHTKFKPLLDTANEYIPYINDNMDLSKIPSENYCSEGDLVIADASEDYDDIGKAIEIANLNNEKVLAGLHTILAKPDLSKIALGFGAYLMKAEYIHFQICVISQGTKVLGLSSNRLSEILVNLPCFSEQTKIVNFLSAIDEKIYCCTDQIGKTEQYKKGLLQQMFV